MLFQEAEKCRKNSGFGGTLSQFGRVDAAQG